MKEYRIDSVEALEHFLAEMNNHCQDFSPDTDFRDLTDKEGRPLFTEDESSYLNRVLLQCYRLCAKEVIDIHLFHSSLLARPRK